MSRIVRDIIYLIHALQSIYFAKAVLDHIKIDDSKKIAVKGSYNALLIFSLQFIGSALEKLPRPFTQNKKELSNILFSGKDTNNQQRCWFMEDRRNAGHMIDITKAFVSELDVNTIEIIKKDLEIFEHVIASLLKKSERENTMLMQLPKISYISNKYAQQQTNAVNIYNAIAQMEECLKNYDNSLAHQIIAAGCIMVVGNNMKLFDINEIATQEQLYNTTIEWRNFIAHLNGLSELSEQKDNMKLVLQECIAQKKYFQPPQQAILAPALEKPALEKPALEKPALEKPALEKPALENDATAVTPKKKKKKKKKKAATAISIIHQSKRQDIFEIDDNVWSNNKIIGESLEINNRILALINASNQKRGLQEYDVTYKISEEDIVHALILHAPNNDDLVFLLKHLNNKFDINFAFKEKLNGRIKEVPFAIKAIYQDSVINKTELVFYFVSLGFNIVPKKNVNSISLRFLSGGRAIDNFNKMKKICLLSSNAGIKLNANNIIQQMMQDNKYLPQLIAYLKYQPHCLIQGVKFKNPVNKTKIYTNVFNVFYSEIDQSSINTKALASTINFIELLLKSIVFINNITNGEVKELPAKLLNSLFHQFNNKFDLLSLFRNCYKLENDNNKFALNLLLMKLSSYQHIFNNPNDFKHTISFMHQPDKVYDDIAITSLLHEATKKSVKTFYLSDSGNKPHTTISLHSINSYKPLLDLTSRYVNKFVTEFTATSASLGCKIAAELKKVTMFSQLCAALKDYKTNPETLQNHLISTPYSPILIDDISAIITPEDYQVLSALINYRDCKTLDKLLFQSIDADHLWQQHIGKESITEIAKK